MAPPRVFLFRIVCEVFEMDENISLTDAINIAMGEYLKASGSLMVNFVFCADIMDTDGGSSTIVVSPDNASTASRIGLSEYAKNLFLLEQQEAVTAYYASLEDDDE